MIRTWVTYALALSLVGAATPSLADDVSELPKTLMTTMTSDLNKGLAEFNPLEILTPKPIEAPAAPASAKVKKKRYAKRRMKKMTKK